MSSVCDLHRCPCTRMLRVLNVLLRGCPSLSATDTVLMMRVCVSEGSLHAQLPSCPCPGPLMHRQEPAAGAVSRGTRAAGHAGPLQLSFCVPHTCEETLPTPSVAHTCTQHAPHSLPSCIIAPRRHLPALLRPASAAKASVPSVAGSWACRHLPGSAAPGTCRPRHFAPANADERASCRVPGWAKTCVACRPRQYSGKARLFRAPDASNVIRPHTPCMNASQTAWILIASEFSLSYRVPGLLD